MSFRDPGSMGLLVLMLAAWTGLLHVAAALVLRFLFLRPASPSPMRTLADIAIILMPATAYFSMQEAVMPQRWRGQAVGGFVLPVGGDWAPLMANALMTTGVVVLFVRHVKLPLALSAAALLGAALAVAMFVPPIRLM